MRSALRGIRPTLPVDLQSLDDLVIKMHIRDTDDSVRASTAGFDPARLKLDIITLSSEKELDRSRHLLLNSGNHLLNLPSFLIPLANHFGRIKKFSN